MYSERICWSWKITVVRSRWSCFPNQIWLYNLIKTLYQVFVEEYFFPNRLHSNLFKEGQFITNVAILDFFIMLCLYVLCWRTLWKTFLNWQWSLGIPRQSVEGHLCPRSKWMVKLTTRKHWGLLNQPLKQHRWVLTGFVTCAVKTMFI